MTEAARLYEAVRGRLEARPLAVLLDVDGTLSPIAPRPEAATVPPETRAAVAGLASAPGVHVALVSGRAARDALRLVGIPGLTAIGNHGFEVVDGAGRLDTDPALEPWRASVAAAAEALRPRIAEVPGAHLEDKGWTLSIHYRQAGPAAAALLRPLLEQVADGHDLRLTEGKMVFELRPPVHVDKGTASVRFLDRLLGAGGSALYAGDDRTDEDAFRAIRARHPGAVAIRVTPETEEAPTATAAEFVLPGVGAMGAFLQRLASEARR